jgi:predicted outer membrane repeat protein
VAVLGAHATSDGIQSFTGGFDDVVIFGNESASHGGGVALLGSADPGDLVFHLRGAVLVNGNQSGGRGGGVYVDTGSLGMIAGPDANALAINDNLSGGTGGGLHARESVLDLDGTFAFDVLRNQSEANGGGCALVSCSGARLQVGTFANNESHGVDGYGGGLWAKDSSYELVEVDFEGNIANGGGGGVRNRRSDVLIHSCDFLSNIAQGAGGGGFSAEESDETMIIASRFNQNQGLVQGGAIHLVDCERLQLDENEILGNHAFSSIDPDHTYGGGAFLQLTHLASTGNEWVENLAGYGGGLYSSNFGTMAVGTPSTLDSDQFEGNTATYVSGGGIYLNGEGSYDIVSCHFSGNLAPVIGSALAAVGNQGVTVDVQDSYFIENGSAITDEAVGLSNADASIRNCVFRDNAGSGVSTFIDAELEVIDSCFCDNAYGIFKQSQEAIEVGGCRFASNIHGDIYGAWVETAMNHFMTICPCGSSPDCDISGDGIVDGVDLAALLGSWGTSNPDADLDMDGVVGGGDLAMLLGCWN